MKKAFIFLTLTVFVNFAFGQGNAGNKSSNVKQTPESQAQKQTDRLTKILDLNETQKAQVYGFALKKNNAINSAWAKFNDKSIDAQARQAEVKGSRERFHGDVSSILTAEQQQKWKNYLEKPADEKAKASKKSKNKKQVKAKSKSKQEESAVDDMDMIK